MDGSRAVEQPVWNIYIKWLARVGPSGGATLGLGAKVTKGEGEPPSRLTGSSWGDGLDFVVERSRPTTSMSSRSMVAMYDGLRW